MKWVGAPRVWIRGGLAALLTTVALYSGSLEWLDLRALNAQFHLRGPRAPRTPIVIVSVDEDSFDELEIGWPWPRALHGKLLDILSQGKPAAIGLGLLFSEPSSRGPEDDAALAQAVGRAGNVVLASALTEVTEASFVKQDLNAPLRPLRENAAGFGPVNLPLDSDALVRAGLLSLAHQGAELPSFDIHLHRLGLRAGIPSAPLPKQNSILVNYRGGPRSFPTVPYYQVINGEIPPEAFRGKIVLVGATSPALHDIFPTPFAPQGVMPAVEIHANILETLFQGLALARLPRLAVVALLLLAALFAVWVTTRTSPVLGLAVVAGAWLVHSGTSFLAFVVWGVWVDQAPLSLALALGYGATVIENFVRERQEKQRLSRFFSPAILREVVRQRGAFALASSRRLITVLFCDIRGFTPIAERLTPEEVARLVREYMTSMTEAVFKYGGTVDKFIGDAIMALYNAPFDQPDHAAQAVRTALELQERLKALSERWEARCGAPLRNGVGINTGEAVVGTLGSVQRLEYTAVGDTVNLASRLETLTKDFATPIIISEPTYRAVKHLFHCRSLGEVTVKGKTAAIRIYGVPGTDERRAVRVVLDGRLTITDARDELRLTVSAQLGDLSVTGLRAVDVPSRLTEGRVVGLGLEVPGLPRAIATEGRVIRSTGDDVGIEFLNVSAEDSRLLGQLVARLQSDRLESSDRPDRGA